MSTSAIGEFEQVEVERGPRSGALLCVAVHSTVLGPALGGARTWHYGREHEAVADAMRLAEAMTMKASAAGLDLGGGKGVIAAPGSSTPRARRGGSRCSTSAKLVDSLGGRYVTAEDVGTGADDMAVIAERTRHVVGLDPAAGGSGDPSPVTALGVMAAMRACVAHRNGGDRQPRRTGGERDRRRPRRLRADPAAASPRAPRVRASDLVPAPAESGCRDLGAEWLEPAEALHAPADVLAPCALGGIVDDRAAETISCGILCGAANNVLASDEAAALLAETGDHLRARFHRQRRRSDQRCGRASGREPRTGAGDGGRDRGDDRRDPRPGRGRRHHSARGCAGGGAGAPRPKPGSPACETGRVRPKASGSMRAGVPT